MLDSRAVPAIATPGFAIEIYRAGKHRMWPVVGFNAAGDPLVIDPTTGRLIVLELEPGERANGRWNGFDNADV